MEYLVIDIETLNASKEAIDFEASLVKPNSNLRDPDKIEANINAKIQKIKTKSALLQLAPVGCIGAKTANETYCFCSFDGLSKEETGLLENAGINVVKAENENEMLLNYGEFLECNCDDETKIVTFNGWRFDLPKIRHAYARADLPIPFPMQAYQPGKDLMIHYAKYFINEERRFIGLGEVCQRLGICEGKLMSGKFFPELIKEKKYIEAILYNVLDCMMTEQVYLRLFQ